MGHPARAVAARGGGDLRRRAGTAAPPAPGLLGLLRRRRAGASAELRTGPRGAGWTRDEIERHVYKNEPESFTRKVEVRTPREVVLTPDGRAAHRQATLDAIRAYHAEGRPARTWPIPFLIRRIAHHVMDHAWELEDRTLTPEETRSE